MYSAIKSLIREVEILSNCHSHEKPESAEIWHNGAQSQNGEEYRNNLHEMGNTLWFGERPAHLLGRWNPEFRLGRCQPLDAVY